MPAFSTGSVVHGKIPCKCFLENLVNLHCFTLKLRHNKPTIEVYFYVVMLCNSWTDFHYVFNVHIRNALFPIYFIC